MLLKFFPRIKETLFYKILHWFYYSYVYIALTGILTILAWVFSIEMYVYYTVITIGGIIPSLLLEDMAPSLAPLGMMYSSVSLKSNNVNEGTSLYGGRWYHLYIQIGLIVLFVFGRLVFNLITDKEKRHIKPKFLYGFALFGTALLIGGIMSPFYTRRDFTYGLVQLLALSGCYFVLLYIINFKDLKHEYYFWIMMTYGLVVAFEVLYAAIFRTSERIATGWGVRNNMAAQMCMCLAGPIYLAIKSKKLSWLYSLAAVLMFAGIIFSNSRGGSATGVIVLLIGTVLLFIFAKRTQRISYGAMIAGVLGIIVTLFLIFPDKTSFLYYRVVGEEASYAINENRIFTWKTGLEQFMEYPAFGVGYYQCPSMIHWNFTYGFIPPRYHGTFIQVLASLGLFGLLAFAYHRYEMFSFAFRKPSLKKTFIVLTIGGLLIASIVDCHFFNLGPGLNYCIALAFLNGECLESPKRIRFKDRMSLLSIM